MEQMDLLIFILFKLLRGDQAVSEHMQFVGTYWAREVILVMGRK